MSNRYCRAPLMVLVALSVCLSAVGASAADYCAVGRSTPSDAPSDLTMPLATAPTADFSGFLRLYVVEPTSQWRDYNNQPYHFALLDLALDSGVALNNGERFHRTKHWDDAAAGFSITDSTNIMVIAVLFSDLPHTAYSNPPSGNPFLAYYPDAAAYARPGYCDSNNTTANSTHTVFVEKATATWCSGCPPQNYWLYNVYNSGNYNFIYTALVDDRNSDASRLVDGFNAAFFPTSYYDGGYQLLIGGYTSAGPYQSAISAAASRAVAGTGAMVKVTWNANGNLDIDYAVALGTPINTCAFPAAPTGETNPLINDPNLYTASVTDPEGDDMWYRYDWGDGEISDWQGPYVSGDPCSQTHAWQAVGSYDVRVQSRDTWLAESPWSAPLTVEAACCVKRGDFNNDGSIAVSDLTALIAFLFRGGPTPSCLDHGDTNGDGVTAVSDLTLLIGYLFRGGASPAACG